ncbi:hypothetical protein HYH02_007600 [Chlamydomonas schloesseri]|uniref:Myb-like domain-containing protein n=1 Tax=Chlamydomonas schloesseri TaxID=2026947 RepID=A0A835WHV2_9CHLO|nr:hypothetical protein HYH02_007600 [Chlamydomonas schloesseri]|eukprot:KAG2447270.1 hypothetical protein HYH02_007600 [Chlamydomonas schloesseri]
MAKKQYKKIRIKLKLGTGVDWEALGPIQEPVPFCIDAGCTTLCFKQFLSNQILDSVFDPSSLRLRLEGCDRELEDTANADGPTTSTYQPKLLRLAEQGVCNGSVVQLDVCATEEEVQRYHEEAEARAEANEVADLEAAAAAEAAVQQERQCAGADAGAAGSKAAAGPPLRRTVQWGPVMDGALRRADQVDAGDSDQELEGCWSDDEFGAHEAVGPDGLYAAGKGRAWLSLLAKYKTIDDSEGELQAGRRAARHQSDGGGRGGRGARRGGPSSGPGGSRGGRGGPGFGPGGPGAGRSLGAVAAARPRQQQQQQQQQHARSGPGVHVGAGAQPRLLRKATAAEGEEDGPPRKQQRRAGANGQQARTTASGEASPGKQGYNVWSIPEIERLVDYAEKNGAGRWSNFLTEENTITRTLEQIKGKWRNLKKRSAKGWQDMRRDPLPEELRRRIDLILKKAKKTG